MEEAKEAPKAPAQLTLAPGKVLVLRVCHAGGVSGDRNQFTWPLTVGAEVSAPDWQDNGECGHGLHGWLWGAGSVQSAGAEWGFKEKDAAWLVVEVDATLVRHIAGDGQVQGEHPQKIKYPRGVIRYIGKASDCAALIAPHAPVALAGRIAAVASAGYNGQASAGDNGQASAGSYGQASAGSYGQASAGDNGQASAGYNGQASAGYNGQASAGDNGQASAGYNGQASAGDNGQASAGYNGQASAGYNGQASAGEKGTIIVRRWDEGAKRYRVTVGYVGEDGIEAGVTYKLDEAGTFVKTEARPMKELKK